MTPTDLILMIADGIRAGKLVPTLGNCSLTDLDSTVIDVATLEDVSSAVPGAFVFRCDVVIDRKTAEPR